MIEVVRPGPLTTVQDLGRPGLAHLGVPISGALDRAALRAANALVGNPEDAAGLETTAQGPVLRFAGPALVAVTGAPAVVTIAGQPAEHGRAHQVGAGEELRIGAATGGLRSYLAVGGGIEVPPVLGSRATDLLTGLGPPPLAAGDVLPVGAAATGRPDTAATATAPATGEVVLAALPGPREDWFTAEAIATLAGTAFAVAPASNRTGLRLEGPALTRRLHGELRSEGIVPGSIQVPPSGQPIVLLADHPTTGGYPIVAVLRDAALDAAAQLRPGQPVRFSLR